MHAGLDRAEIVVLHFLSLGRLGAKERAAAGFEILAPLVQRLVHQEIFLLRAHGGGHAAGGRVAKQAQDAQRVPVDGLHGAQ